MTTKKSTTKEPKWLTEAEIEQRVKAINADKSEVSDEEFSAISRDTTAEELGKISTIARK